MSVDSAKLKKDVYCEKPLSSSVYEGRAMVDAARKYQIIFQTGSMQRSWSQFRHAVELIRNNYIGEIKTINVAIGAPYISCDLPTPTPENINWDNWIGPSHIEATIKILPVLLVIIVGHSGEIIFHLEEEW